MSSNFAKLECLFSELGLLEPVGEERVDEPILLRHLHQVVSLFPQSSDCRKYRESRVLDALVLLGPQVDDEMSKSNRSSCSSNASTAMDDGLLFGFGREEHEREDVQHLSEGGDRISTRYTMIRPARVVELNHSSVSDVEDGV